MTTQQKDTIRVYALSIALALAVGGLSALLSAGSMQRYESYVQPPLAPPGFVFPIVWTALFALMGVSAAMVYLAKSDLRRDAARIYALQLALNFAWPILFFRFQLFLAAFVWLIVLWAVVAVMIAIFDAAKRGAGLLQIPYFLWVAFAGYLNLGIFILNPTPL